MVFYANHGVVLMREGVFKNEFLGFWVFGFLGFWVFGFLG